MNKLKSIIIVTFNSANTITQTLDSVFSNIEKPYEVIVVDNDSSDSTVELVQKLYKDRVKLFEQPNNLGFSRANNIAVNNASGDLLFFLNPDTKILDKSINDLFDCLNNKRIGMAAPMLIDQKASPIPSARKFPTLTGAFEEYVLNKKGSYDFYIPSDNKPCEVEYVAGAAFVMRREFFLRVGGFDERYFLYYEDIDLCRRIHFAGKKILYVPNLKVFHSVGASSKSNSRAKKLNRESSRRYHGLIGYIFLNWIFTFVRVKNKIRLS